LRGEDAARQISAEQLVSLCQLRRIPAGRAILTSSPGKSLGGGGWLFALLLSGASKKSLLAFSASAAVIIAAVLIAALYHERQYNVASVCLRVRNFAAGS
jgi:hypothetical protein